MKRVLILSLFALVVLLGGRVLDANAQAHTFYVAMNGNDFYPGTLAQPWRTIQHAADVVQPGDTVYVRAGTYNEGVTIAAAGTAFDPITFAAYPGETVTLDGGGSEWAAFVIEQGVSYFTLDGFRLQNYRQTGVDVRGTNSYITLTNLDASGSESGARITWGYSGDPPLYGAADHITIRDSRIHDNHLCGIDCTPGPCDNLAFQRLTIENNGVGVQSFAADGIAVERGMPILIEDVSVRNNGGDGIDVNSRDTGGNVSGVIVRRNQVANNQRQGIKLWAGGRIENNAVWGQGINPVIVGVYTSTVEVVNNTIAYNMWDASYSARDYAFIAAYPDLGFSPRVTLTLRNNIFAYNTGPAVGSPTGVYLGAGVRLTESNNLYFSRDDGEIQADFVVGRDQWFTRAEIGNGTWTTWTGQGAGNVILDPRFVNALAGDFHLQSSGPAIDAGTSTGAPGNDLEGRTRTPPPDIGAYERTTSSVAWWLFLPFVRR